MISLVTLFRDVITIKMCYSSYKEKNKRTVTSLVPSEE